MFTSCPVEDAMAHTTNFHKCWDLKFEHKSWAQVKAKHMQNYCWDRAAPAAVSSELPGKVILHLTVSALQAVECKEVMQLLSAGSTFPFFSLHFF